MGVTYVLRQSEAVAIGRVILQMKLFVELNVEILADSAVFLVELFGCLGSKLVYAHLVQAHRRQQTLTSCSLLCNSCSCSS